MRFFKSVSVFICNFLMRILICTCICILMLWVVSHVVCFGSILLTWLVPEWNLAEPVLIFSALYCLIGWGIGWFASDFDELECEA